MNNGPKLWNKLLLEAPPTSLLMGGAVIDWHLGHEAKDYDIFHTYKPGEPVVPHTWEMKVDFNDEAWLEQHQNEYLQGIDADNNNPIGSIYEYLVDGEHKVQLIGVNYLNPAFHMKNFDHSLTLGRYTKAGLFIHKKVFDSIHSHVVQYVSKNNDPKAVLRSYNRAKAKTKKYSGGHDGNWDFKGFIAIEKQPWKPADPFEF